MPVARIPAIAASPFAVSQLRSLITPMPTQPLLPLPGADGHDDVADRGVVEPDGLGQLGADALHGEEGEVGGGVTPIT